MRRWIMNMGLTWKFLLILIVFVAIMGATGWMATRTINSLASDVDVGLRMRAADGTCAQG